MGRALHYLSTRILRSRAGLALLVGVLVLAIVGAARALSGPAGLLPTTHTPARPLVVTSPAVPDDGPASPGAVVSPTSIPGVQPPEAVADAFAAEWVAHSGVSAADWQSRLAPLITTRLARQLAGVDPASVPAERIIGEPAMTVHAATIVEVEIPVDTGTLHLRMTAGDGGWLVDGVDWERA